MKPPMWKQVHLAADGWRTIHLIGDASEVPRGSGYLVVKVSFWAIDFPSGIKRGAVTLVPEEFLEAFEGRATYIAIGELCAFPLPIMLWSSAFARSHLLIWSDNLGILSASVAGSSAVFDINAVVAGLHLFLIKRG